MKLEKLKPEHIKELQRIQNSIPKSLAEGVMKETQPGKEMLDTLKQALNDPELTPEQRRKTKLIIESGYLEKKVMSEDPEVIAEIDTYIEKEIEKSVRLGRLPDKKKKNKNIKKKLKRVVVEKNK
jgi:hypothetical protein